MELGNERNLTKMYDDNNKRFLEYEKIIQELYFDKKEFIETKMRLSKAEASLNEVLNRPPRADLKTVNLESSDDEANLNSNFR